MRRSREATAESRRTIVDTASRLFRAHGLAGVGVADVMVASGMTHGGFYRHFPSKEALVAEAMAHAFGEVSERLSATQTGDGLVPPPAAKLATYVADYLSAGHVAHPARGCPMAAAGSEAPHAGAEVGSTFSAGAELMVAKLTGALDHASPSAPNSSPSREDALRLLSSLVGAVVIARAVGDGPLQDDVLEAVRADPLVMRALAAASA
jgi:TetR/AcrR family transcriptional repressor of nem operon